MDYTLQLVTAFTAAVLVATVIAYERWAGQLRAERDRAIEHAQEAQELFDAMLGVERLEAIQRHPSGSNVRLLRVVDGGAS